MNGQIRDKKIIAIVQTGFYLLYLQCCAQVTTDCYSNGHTDALELS